MLSCVTSRKTNRRTGKKTYGQCGFALPVPRRANAAEMMIAIFIMMIIALAFVMRRVQAYLLRWQPQFERQV
jgi:hypothetical protein